MRLMASRAGSSGAPLFSRPGLMKLSINEAVMASAAWLKS